MGGRLSNILAHLFLSMHSISIIISWIRLHVGQRKPGAESQATASQRMHRWTTARTSRTSRTPHPASLPRSIIGINKGSSPSDARHHHAPVLPPAFPHPARQRDFLEHASRNRSSTQRLRSFLMSESSKQLILRETYVLACNYVDLFFAMGGRA